MHTHMAHEPGNHGCVLCGQSRSCDSREVAEVKRIAFVSFTLKDEDLRLIGNSFTELDWLKLGGRGVTVKVSSFCEYDDMCFGVRQAE